MLKKNGRLLLALLAACAVMTALSGCDKLKKEPQTEVVTEKVTEAPTESETEKVTEKITEKVTEAPTETESETEAVTETEPRILTPEEEKAEQTSFDQYRFMYAIDDINVRAEPNTEEDNIFDSFQQGDRVTVIGETPNWAVVLIEEFNTTGYVAKRFLSDSEVAEKTSEEREQAILQELGVTETNASGGSDDTDGSVSGNSDDAETSSGGTTTPANDTSDIDAQYGVENYAESFTVYAMTGANLRATPAQDGEILQTIPSGSSLKALGYTERWYKVELNGTVGYVNRNLFSDEPAD